MTTTANDQIQLVLDLSQKNAHKDWLLCAERALVCVARKQALLTSDDVWDWLRTQGITAKTHDNRAMGSVFRNADRDLLIKPLNQWQVTRRRVAHRRPVRVWRSLLLT